MLAASTILTALPEFLIAMALLLALSVGLRWFPLQGGSTLFAAVGEASGLRSIVGPEGQVAATLDVAWHLTLPALTLVLATSAGFALLARGAVTGVRAEPYLTTARAKGLGERAVSLRHAVPNALLPVLTLFGVRLGQVFGGALVVEASLPSQVWACSPSKPSARATYPVLQAIFLLGSLGILAANFAVELATARSARGVSTRGREPRANVADRAWRGVRRTGGAGTGAIRPAVVVPGGALQAPGAATGWDQRHRPGRAESMVVGRARLAGHRDRRDRPRRSSPGVWGC